MSLIDLHMSELVQSEAGIAPGEADEDTDFGLNYPVSYALETWHNWRNHGVYPEAGGYNDQDEALIADWSVLNRRYAWARQTGEARPRLPNDDTGDWKDILS